MQVILDDSNYVSSYATVGQLFDGTEIDAPKNMIHFCEHYTAYKLENGELVYDSQKEDRLRQEELLEELRERRKVECFAYMDRGKFWYDSLTETQLEELNVFYEAWLRVTETLEIPTKPEWLE